MKEWAKGIDWSKTDREIAEETGRSRGAVWTTRNLMFQGKTPMPTRRRKVFRDCKPPSRLVGRFELLWRVLAGPELVKEFRFHPVRKWRADFAHLPSRTLIEIEGGIYVNGRHNRAGGFAADLKKYLEAALAGWRVVRLGPNELTADYVGRLVSMVSGG
jgi:very-short-patch-repair endonuclease